MLPALMDLRNTSQICSRHSIVWPIQFTSSPTISQAPSYQNVDKLSQTVSYINCHKEPNDDPFIVLQKDKGIYQESHASQALPPYRKASAKPVKKMGKDVELDREDMR